MILRNPFTWEELVDKFHDVAGALPPPERTAVLAAMPDRPTHSTLTGLHDALRDVWVGGTGGGSPHADGDDR